MIKNQITFLKISKYFKKNNVSIAEFQKFLKKKGFVITRNNHNKKSENNIGAISRTFFSCLIIISVFFITPLVISFTNERISVSKVHENKSKNKLKNLLKNQNQKLDTVLDDKFLFAINLFRLSFELFS